MEGTHSHNLAIAAILYLRNGKVLITQTFKIPNSKFQIPNCSALSKNIQHVKVALMRYKVCISE